MRSFRWWETCSIGSPPPPPPPPLLPSSPSLSPPPLLPLAFFAILVLTAYLLWKTVGMMPRVKPQHQSSKAKSGVTWDDVAGVEEVRAELEGVVDFLRDPKRFEALGAKPPKEMLLYGPPGTGKT